MHGGFTPLLPLTIECIAHSLRNGAKQGLGDESCLILRPLPVRVREVCLITYEFEPYNDSNDTNPNPIIAAVEKRMSNF